MRQSRYRWCVAALVFSTSIPALAMPNFARRESFTCGVCHSTIPLLNRTGYAYRNAGFRVPDSLGDEDAKRAKEFGDMNTARIQSLANWVHTDSGTKTTDSAQINFFEATLYPVTGSWGKWFASMAELSMAPEDFFEVENAYLRAAFGSPESHFNVRAGVFHPWEGYGASDRPVSLARPTLQTSTAKDRTTGISSFFTPWNFDQAGIEVGYTQGPFNVVVSMFNGIFVRDEGGSLKAFPNQGGQLLRNADDPNHNRKDFQIFANQFLGNKAAVSAYYYHGRITIPTTTANLLDSFDRLALYGTVPVGDHFIYAGAQIGWDDNFSAGLPVDRFTSKGAFAAAHLSYNTYIGGLARYDFFDPSNNSTNDATHAVTLAVNGALLNGAQAIFEYRYVNQDQGATKANNQTHSTQIRLIYIF
jgi:hypothetical protein